MKNHEVVENPPEEYYLCSICLTGIIFHFIPSHPIFITAMLCNVMSSSDLEEDFLPIALERMVGRGNMINRDPVIQYGGESELH